MTIQDLLNKLLKYCPLPKKLDDKKFIENLENFLEPFISTIWYTKRQILLSEGQVADYIYFVDKGLVRGYYVNHPTMKEQTHFLWNGDSIITVPTSFFDRTPSSLFIETMTEATLTAITYNDFMNCAKAFPILQMFSRNLMLQYGAYEAKRSYEAEAFTSWQRYLRLLKTHPNIEQQVSQKVIASYLNITPESLSRLLNQKGHP